MQRVVIYAPYGKDADTLAQIVAGEDIEVVKVTDCSGLDEQLGPSCAALVVTEEALGPHQEQVFLRHLQAQPIWAALPILALVADASRLPPALRGLGMRAYRSELVVLQRPTHPETLRSTVQTLIMSRQRQYQVADHLETLKRKEKHLEFLLAELDHRVKNLLGKILSLLSLTRRETIDAEGFSAKFEARTRALVTAHDMLNGKNNLPATIGSLLENALAPFLPSVKSNVQTEGPELSLLPHGGLALAMAFNELATNSVKYGALSADDGIVSVRWALEGETPHLVVDWIEERGPAPKDSTRTGFGTKLLTVIVALELDGEADLVFRPEGIHWQLRAPYAGAER